MNDHDLDALGRRAAATVRADAEATADSREALDRLLAAQAPANAAPTVATTTLPHGDGSSARRWRCPRRSGRAGDDRGRVGLARPIGQRHDRHRRSGTGHRVGGSPAHVDPCTHRTARRDHHPVAGAGAHDRPRRPRRHPGTTPGTTPGTSVPADPTDPFAGITPPPGAAAPTIDDVPTLLPAAPPDPDRTTCVATARVDPCRRRCRSSGCGPTLTAASTPSCRSPRGRRRRRRSRAVTWRSWPGGPTPASTRASPVR